jgi:hypothetical protein
MPSQIYKNAYLSLNGGNMSASVQELELTYEAETQDNTTMGDDTRSMLGGLKNWGVNVTFLQDFSSGAVDATIFPLVGTIVPIELRPDAGAVGIGNPKFTGYGLIKSYNPLSGKIGDLETCKVEIVPAKSGANPATLVRATA